VAVARPATATLRRLPAPLAYLLADLASPVLGAFTLWRERRLAARGRGLFRNLRIASRGTLPRRRKLWFLFGWARHTARLGVDFCRVSGIDASNVEQIVDTRGISELRRIVDAGEPLIAVSGHIGVWELCSHVWSLLGYPITVVARPLSSAPLDSFVRDLRLSGGQRVIAQRKALWPLKKALDRGETVGLLVDEDAGESGVFAPFLGTDAATTPAPAILHLVTGAPLAVVACHRTGSAHYRLGLWRVIRHAPTGDREADLQAITIAMNEALSEAILAQPAQWMWGSRRFQTRPTGERPGPDGLPPSAASPGQTS